MQLSHGDKLVGDNLSRHDAANLLRLMSRHAKHPGKRIKQIAQQALKTDAKQAAKQRVDGGDQGNKAQQHGGNDYCDLKAGKNIFAQHFK
ncbi:hypothetical protein D3C75_923220 [compost metagenome]